MQLKNDMLKRYFFRLCFLSHPFPLPSLFRFFFIQTETDLAIQVEEAAQKAIEECKHDHPDVDESAIKLDLPETPAQKAQSQVQAADRGFYLTCTILWLTMYTIRFRMR